MVAKRLVVGLFCAVLAISTALFIVLDKTAQKFVPEEKTTEQKQVKVPVARKPIEPKFDLYASSLYDLPLSSIVDISKLPSNVKKYIDSVLEQAQGFYFLRYNQEKKVIRVFLQNPITNKNIYNRHSLEVLEIRINDDGSYSKEITSIGYNGEENEIENAVDEIDDKSDVWMFDKTTEPYLPLKHKRYNEKGKLCFTEIWDYSPDKDVKYQMKNAKNKIVSIHKEILENETNLRREHIFYDDKGSVELSIIINYDGANITRFTYFNSKNLDESFTVIAEYADGIKVGETVYNQNYMPIEFYKINYVDGIRKSIEQLDSNLQEILKISS